VQFLRVVAAAQVVQVHLLVLAASEAVAVGGGVAAHCRPAERLVLELALHRPAGVGQRNGRAQGVGQKVARGSRLNARENLIVPRNAQPRRVWLCPARRLFRLKVRAARDNAARPTAAAKTLPSSNRPSECAL